MADKIYVDKTIWQKEWFINLDPTMKCLVKYIFENCDSVGVWKQNLRLASMQIGDTITPSHFQFLPVSNFKVSGDKIIVLDYIPFQYGKLDGSLKDDKDIIYQLEKNNLLAQNEQYVINLAPSTTTKAKTVARTVARANTAEIEQDATAKKQWAELEKALPTDTIMRKTIIKNYITEHKPLFIDPYAYAWNIFASEMGLVQIQSITDKRIMKMGVRLKEAEFDFFAILMKIRTSTFLKGNNNQSWKVDFDFIIESQENYIKILEGKYV